MFEFLFEFEVQQARINGVVPAILRWSVDLNQNKKRPVTQVKTIIPRQLSLQLCLISSSSQLTRKNISKEFTDKK